MRAVSRKPAEREGVSHAHFGTVTSASAAGGGFPLMPFVISNGARIHWQARGAGPAVLLIMGHRYSAEMWYPLADDLARTHRVITFDNRGSGQSDTTDVTIEQLAADALAVLDAAQESRAHVYGVSMGGATAAEFAMTHPERVRSLTLGCTMLKTAQTPRSLAARLIYRLPRWAMGRLMLTLATPKTYGSVAPLDWVARDRAAMAKSAFTARGLRAQSIAIARYATSPERARAALTMPVLVLHGDEDRVVPVQHGRDLTAALPGSLYREFAGAGHNYLVATGGESNRVFLDFIGEADRSVP